MGLRNKKMTIKIISKDKLRGYKYKSSKNILMPKDIKDADDFDLRLNEKIKEIEHILEDKKIVCNKNKKDPLMAWYVIGKNINKFLKDNFLAKEDENPFWNGLYRRSSVINKTNPTKKIGRYRNDFRLASILAEYQIDQIKKVGSWALWREVLSYKAFLCDERILKWIIEELIRSPRTRDEARPLLKKVAYRFKGIDTLMLNENELLEKIKQIS